MTSRADGTFVLAHVLPGTCGVIANLAGRTVGVSRDVRVEPGGVATVALELAATSAVRVHYLGDEPCVYAIGRLGGVYAAGTVVAQGCVGTLRLPAGTAAIELYRFTSHKDTPVLLASREVIVPAGEPLDVELR